MIFFSLNKTEKKLHPNLQDQSLKTAARNRIKKTVITRMVNSFTL